MTLVAARIPHSRPCLGPEEEEAVRRVVRSGHLAQGPEVEALEEEAARLAGTRHAVALGHGTAALHLGLLALGAGPGRTVLLPSYGCVSLLNAVAYTGATPVLVDCARGSTDMDLDEARAKTTGDTAAVLVPFLFGRPLRVSGRVLTDGTHALGATLGTKPASAQGEACAFSFYATKMLAGGEAGLLATNRVAHARAARDLRSYDERPDWRPRFNYKMGEMQAAMLREQIKKLPAFLERRRRLAAEYRRALQHLDLPDDPPGAVPYRFLVRTTRLDEALKGLRERGVQAARPVFRPLHRYLRQKGFPHAERAWRQTLSLPLYPGLTDQEAERVAGAAREVLR